MICPRNLHFLLLLEMFKVAKNLSAPIVSEIFEKRNNAHDLQNPFEFVLPKVHTVFRGIKSNSYFDPHVWNMVSLEMKKLTTINAFKRKVRNGSQKTAQVGYVNHTYKV